MTKKIQAATSQTQLIPKVFDSVRIHRDLAPILALHAANPTNSYLLLGPQGSGKAEWASAFAAALMCSDGGCGVCNICLGAMARSHPDLNVVANNDGALSVDQARQAIRYSLLSPNEARHRVVIIDEFDNIGRVGVVLLKAIEEPPLRTVFVLSGTHVSKEMATIASRCVKVEFSRLGVQEISEYLREKGIDEVDAFQAASISQGSLTRALELSRGGFFKPRMDMWTRASRSHFQDGSLLMGMVIEILRFVGKVTAARKVENDQRLEQMTANLRASTSSKGILRELEARLTRELKWSRRTEIELGIAIMATEYKVVFGDVSNFSAQYLKYERFLILATEARRRLGAQVSETLVLANLLGAAEAISLR